jgi:acyl-[acyl carrier protein]--UDP-N-acetylglucosamine O-acyltransferase
VFTTTAVGARVEAGIDVGPVCGINVRGVAVSMKKRMGVDEGVVVNVSVTVGVIVRVFVMVGVGPVAVGNGP